MYACSPAQLSIAFSSLSSETGNEISMDENNRFVYLSKKNIKIAEFILAYFSKKRNDRDIKSSGCLKNTSQPEYCTWRYQFKSSTPVWILVIQGREQKNWQKNRKKCTGLDTGELLSVQSDEKKRQLSQQEWKQQITWWKKWKYKLRAEL